MANTRNSKTKTKQAEQAELTVDRSSPIASETQALRNGLSFSEELASLERIASQEVLSGELPSDGGESEESLLLDLVRYAYFQRLKRRAYGQICQERGLKPCYRDAVNYTTGEVLADRFGVPLKELYFEEISFYEFCLGKSEDEPSSWGYDGEEPYTPTARGRLARELGGYERIVEWAEENYLYPDLTKIKNRYPDLTQLQTLRMLFLSPFVQDGLSQKGLPRTRAKDYSIYRLTLLKRERKAKSNAYRY